MSISSNQAVPSPAQVWSLGDYPDVCDRMIPGLGARLVELAEVRAGDAVLDAAAGSGNVALPAAGARAHVSALDITPALLEAGSERARAAGLDVSWVLGDVQALPFADASFDTVLSCVGVQFCAEPAAAAGELVRVCRPGGRIALVAWTREGFIGQVLAAVAKATSGGATNWSPLDWGCEDKVSGLFDGHVREIAFDREQVQMRADSPTEWVDYMARAYGPLVRARVMLEGRAEWEPLRARLTEIATTHDMGEDDTFATWAEYLTTLMER